MASPKADLQRPDVWDDPPQPPAAALAPTRGPSRCPCKHPRSWTSRSRVDVALADSQAGPSSVKTSAAWPQRDGAAQPRRRLCRRRGRPVASSDARRCSPPEAQAAPPAPIGVASCPKVEPALALARFRADCNVGARSTFGASPSGGLGLTPCVPTAPSPVTEPSDGVAVVGRFSTTSASAER